MKPRTGPRVLLDTILEMKANYELRHFEKPNMILLGKKEYLEIRQLATHSDKGNVNLIDNTIAGLTMFMSNEPSEIHLGVIE